MLKQRTWWTLHWFKEASLPVQEIAGGGFCCMNGSRDFAAGSHGAPYAHRQAMAGLQSLGEHAGDVGEITLFEAAAAGEIDVFTEPLGAVACSQAGAADEGQARPLHMHLFDYGYHGQNGRVIPMPPCVRAASSLRRRGSPNLPTSSLSAWTSTLHVRITRGKVDPRSGSCI